MGHLRSVVRIVWISVWQPRQEGNFASSFYQSHFLLAKIQLNYHKPTRKAKAANPRTLTVPWSNADRVDTTLPTSPVTAMG